MFLPDWLGMGHRPMGAIDGLGLGYVCIKAPGAHALEVDILFVPDVIVPYTMQHTICHSKTDCSNP